MARESPGRRRVIRPPRATHIPHPSLLQHRADPCPRAAVSGRLFSGLMAAFSLDHLRALGPLAFRWTTVFSEPGGPTAFKWSKRTQVVQTDRPRHDMRDAVPPCKTTGGGETGGRGAGTALAAAQAIPTAGPLIPSRPTPPTRPEVTRAGHHGWSRAPTPSTTPRITLGEHTQNHTRMIFIMSPPGNATGRPPNKLQGLTIWIVVA